MLRSVVVFSSWTNLNKCRTPPFPRPTVVHRDTPLAAAIHGGQTEVVRLLLEEGADMDLLPYGEDGNKPSKKSLIELAAGIGKVEIMRLLIQAKMFKDKAEQLAEDAKAKGAEAAAPS